MSEPPKKDIGEPGGPCSVGSEFTPLIVFELPEKDVQTRWCSAGSNHQYTLSWFVCEQAEKVISNEADLALI